MNKLAEKISWMVAKIVYEHEFEYAIKERGVETTISEVYDDFKVEIDELVEYIENLFGGHLND